MNPFHRVISCDVSDDYDIDIFPNLIFMHTPIESIYCCYYCIYYLLIFIWKGETGPGSHPPVMRPTLGYWVCLKTTSVPPSLSTSCRSWGWMKASKSGSGMVLTQLHKSSGEWFTQWISFVRLYMLLLLMFAVLDSYEVMEIFSEDNGIIKAGHHLGSDVWKN